ncbi:MAG TPA: serine/threonine-protein kinase [Kofleriaceae bacterium]|jgi:serine/threonine-protein kinase
MNTATTPTITIEAIEPPPVPADARARFARGTQPSPVTQPIAPVRVGAWLGEGEIGRGGMASVYAVRHKRFGKRAALKLAHPDAIGPTFTVETFLREARAANLVDHPGVADVFATGTYEKRPYLVMERLRGQTLGQRIDRGPIELGEALGILGEIADVLAAAHAAGVVHRDLKLDNVFLLDVPAAAGRTVKVLDWGVARIDGEPDPLQGMIAGTIAYVPPEQLRGEIVTSAADVYSLGVLAYRVLAGKAPFAGATDMELMRAHVHQPVPDARAVMPSLPQPLAQLLKRMLAKDPAARPTVADVRDAFATSRASLLPVVAQPVALVDVLGRPVTAGVPGPVQRAFGAALSIALATAAFLALFS